MSSDRQQKIPVSLGKPSFRRRLDDYYSLVAPDQLQNDWPKRFQQIWDLYGGSDEGESKLATKLAKKYGGTVRFLTAASVVKKKDQGSSKTDNQQQQQEGDMVFEEYFQLNASQVDSGVLDCLSTEFDPVAILYAPLDQVCQTNPWMATSNTLLDRVEMFHSHLPESDPLYVPRTALRKHPLIAETPKPKPLSALARIAAPLEKGPCSLLFRAMTERKRVRVLVRYIDCIRGTLTGYVIGFDKHFNMIMRDVEEVYVPRCANVDDRTNLEIELERRIKSVSSSNCEGEWALQHRQLKQIMVRGDNIVSVFLAEQERSAWPRTAKSPEDTTYRTKSVKRDVPPAERVGTPGSLIYASRRALFQNQGEHAKVNEKLA